MCAHQFETTNLTSACTLQVTVYGDSYIAAGSAGTNGQGACSFGTNAANADGLPWASAPGDAPVGPAGVKTTFIAMNDVDWGLSNMCGTCLWFRSQGKHALPVVCQKSVPGLMHTQQLCNPNP